MPNFLRAQATFLPNIKILNLILMLVKTPSDEGFQLLHVGLDYISNVRCRVHIANDCSCVLLKTVDLRVLTTPPI